MNKTRFIALLLAVILITSLTACGKKAADEPGASSGPNAYGYVDTEYTKTYSDAKGKPVYDISYTLPRFPEEDTTMQRVNEYFDSLFMTAKSNGVSAEANLSGLSKPWRETAVYSLTYADDDYLSFDVTVTLDTGEEQHVISRELSLFSRETGLRMSLENFETSKQAINLLCSSVAAYIEKEYTTVVPEGATVYNTFNRQSFCLTENGFRVAFPSGIITLSERGPIAVDLPLSDFADYYGNLPNMPQNAGNS